MVRKIAQVALLLASAVGGYMIYASINGPIHFEKEKQARFTEVIQKLKDIRNAQDAHFSIKGDYAKDYNSLINFIETAKFPIVTQRDTSWVAFDQNYKIDVLKQGIVVDTLGFVSVKDSLFGKSDRYKTMMNVPFAKNGEKFEMEVGVIEKNNYNAPVYEAKISKKVVLHDLDQDEVKRELLKKGVNDVKGEFISVGSLTEVSSNGNWPTLYDAKTNAKTKK